MQRSKAQRLLRLLPISVSAALVLTACGSDADVATPVGQAEAPADSSAAPAIPANDPAPAAPESKAAGEKITGANAAGAVKKAAGQAPAVKSRSNATSAVKGSPTSKTAAGGSVAGAKAGLTESDAAKAENDKIYEAKKGSTDIGVTKEAIKLGSINMHGMALGNLATLPMVRGNLATAQAINDRGGVLGRRINIVDCDDGPGEVSRAKACVKKLVNQDKIFGLITGVDWATASLHDDLRQYKLPYFGSWAYSQTEWQDPYMFPSHMSMIHEAMAGANWVRNVIKPKTYGLICLTSPEMQLACSQVTKILDAAGSKMVKKADVAISETSMSSQVLAMRAANPEHIIHYVINAATISKFVVEAAQQGYYPSKGISGNHMAVEVIGSLFGKWPAGRYWTNTTYKLWGGEYMTTMNKYARGNRGLNHHVVQSGYTGLNIFAQAAKSVGPNLTRERAMAALANGTWSSDASLDQKFSYSRAERTGSHEDQSWNPQYGQGREFMYKYTDTNSISNPDGTPNGWAPDPDQPVIYTWK